MVGGGEMKDKGRESGGGRGERHLEKKRGRQGERLRG